LRHYFSHNYAQYHLNSEKKIELTNQSFGKESAVSVPQHKTPRNHHVWLLG